MAPWGPAAKALVNRNTLKQQEAACRHVRCNIHQASSMFKLSLQEHRSLVTALDSEKKVRF